MFKNESFVSQNGITFNYKFHSSLRADSQSKLAEQIETNRPDLATTLKRTDILILTFGTAWVYELKSPKMLVANCHKVDQSLFTKRILSIEEITIGFQQLITKLKEVNPDLKVLLTVSPIRHTKEGLSNNNLSKSVLRVACQEICEAHDFVDYFPAYEILIDDLRDYRFFEKDMIHPNEQAQDYIWQKFSAFYFNQEALDFNTEWLPILSSLNHKPFNPQSEQHQVFLRQLLDRLQNLNYPVDVTEEINRVKSHLIS